MHRLSHHPIIQAVVTSVLAGISKKLLYDYLANDQPEIEIQIFLEDASAAVSVEASLRELLQEVGIEEIRTERTRRMRSPLSEAAGR